MVQEFIGRGRPDDRGVGDPVSAGPLNLAGYLSNHLEHPQNQPEIFYVYGSLQEEK